MFSVNNVRRHKVTHAPLAAGATRLVGGIESADFRCTCGKTWHAVATDRNVSDGQFALTSTSITVNCPSAGCKLQWRVDGDEFNAL
jgi:hypothetical protein